MLIINRGGARKVSRGLVMRESVSSEKVERGEKNYRRGAALFLGLQTTRFPVLICACPRGLMGLSSILRGKAGLAKPAHQQVAATRNLARASGWRKPAAYWRPPGRRGGGGSRSDVTWRMRNVELWEKPGNVRLGETIQ